MENRVGPPVRGADFFGRDPFVDRLWRKLELGHVLLAAPRRFGKTSVMYRLIDEPRHDFRIVHADLEHLTSPADFLLELVVKLSRENKLAQGLDGVAHVAKSLLIGLRDTVDEVEAFNVKLKLREQMQPEWPEIGRQVFERIGKIGQPVLFILDEFPMMIDRMQRSGAAEEARYLLRWLRAVRQSPDLAGVRFLIAGSIGIDAVLGAMGEISAINDFERLTLEPFSEDTADDFLVRLAESEKVRLSPECRRRMLDKIGIYVPYFLQILYSKVSEATFHTGSAPTPEAIDRLYRDKVLGMDCKTYFEHYYGRLGQYYEKREERAVKELLRTLARTGELSRDACIELYRAGMSSGSEEFDIESFHRSLSSLENDFYIRFDAERNRYEFACKLLRDWWLRHYGMEDA